MNEQEERAKLEVEGFSQIMVLQDGPNFEYATHTHEKAGVHIILEGEMVLTDQSGNVVVKAGERIDIPAGTVHSAKMGASGCKYLVGEK